LCRIAFAARAPEAALNETPQALRDAFAQVAATDAPAERVLIVRVGDNERHYLGRHFPRRAADGGLAGFVGQFEDVTRSARLEERLSRTTEKLHDFIRSTSDWAWEPDAELCLSEVSPRIAAILAAPPQVLLGKPLLDLGELPEPHPGLVALPDLIARHRPFRNRLLIMRDDTGNPRRIHLSGTPVFGVDGAFVGYRGTGTDVTRTMEAERSLMEARRDLEESLTALELRNKQLARVLAQAQAASRAKTDFLALTSHELRTPLNAIAGFAELCRMQRAGPLPDKYVEYLNNIQSAVQHLSQIIENMLDSVRAETAGFELDLQAVDVAEVVEQVVSMVRMQAADKRLALQVGLVPEGLQLLADPVRVRQILINLLSNAVKFTGDGGSVGIDVIVGQDHTVDVAVWDTGIGISQPQQALVFDRFHRVSQDDPQRANAEGMGLGLYLARQLAQHMGGDIEIESEPDRGSRFTLCLPLWRAF